MSTQGRILTAVAIGLATFILLEVLTKFSILLTLICGVLIGLAVAIVLVARSRGEDPVEVAREVRTAAAETITEPKAMRDERQAHEQLLRASVRFCTSAAADDLAIPLRKLVDDIRALLPRALEFSPGSETTFNVLKLAREDLPHQLNAFVEMSTADRDKNRAKLAEQFGSLSEKIGKITDIIDRGRMDEFDAQSSFLDVKFS